LATETIFILDIAQNIPICKWYFWYRFLSLSLCKKITMKLRA